MKYYFLVVSALLASCSTPPPVGPKPDIRPSVASNAATRKEIAGTRKSISETRKNIKDSQIDAKEADANLQSVEDDIKKLLHE